MSTPPWLYQALTLRLLQPWHHHSPLQGPTLPLFTYASVIWSTPTATHISTLYMRFHLQPVNRIHEYYDLLFMFKVINQTISSPDVDSLFSARLPPYELRRYNVLHEETHTTTHDFSTPIPRLRRLWNAIPPVIQGIKMISLFNRAISDMRN